MAVQHISIKMPTDYIEGQLRKKIAVTLGIRQFDFRITSQSLDARNKRRIHWHLRVAVTSQELSGSPPEKVPGLEITYKKRDERVLITGNGPAGFFAALVLQKAGFNVTIIDRGTDVDKRAAGIARFEQTGQFDPVCNYAFGEGGAGTFSDGKLTSRSKRISQEKQFMLDSYIRAGGPEEIAWLNHPHLGSDNLKNIVVNLRHEFEALGGKILFETRLDDLVIRDGRIKEATTSAGGMEADMFFIAPGHSAFETYRMLIKRGIPFRPKNFAIGSRVEHAQALINKAQWGCTQLPGVKAAEYRLVSKADTGLPVYTFCMCPGGKIVPATGYEDVNIVNGMSLYNRSGEFANAACVAGVNLSQILGREVDALESLDWLEELEHRFHEEVDGFSAPTCAINDFIHGNMSGSLSRSSYPLGLTEAPLWEWLPSAVASAMRDGLIHFSQQLKGFDQGQIMGLESKTSAPVQVVRDDFFRPAGFKNCWIIGEGSGWAGGIISSGADGIKAAMQVIALE
ncbi:FAD-dependent monooxygenase [bacterium]|nr:FAD-dependent monooxygenase [bacterium]